jgi:NAD(P)H-flavin reductase
MASCGEARRFYPGHLVAREDAGGGLTRITLEARPDDIATYRSPGQYVEIRANGQTGFFVLAGDPGARAWDLVMRSGGGVSDVLLALTPVASLEVTHAIGTGFPLEDAHGHPLIVALGGTGIAAGSPIVKRRIAEDDAYRTKVFVGIKTRGELPNRADFEAWMRAGVDVYVCLSQDDGVIEGIGYAHGYVQDVIRARASVLRLSGGRIFAVGLTSMIEALRALAPQLGIDPGDVYTNH